MYMKEMYTKKGLFKRIAFLILAPAFWGLCVYVFQRPVDTRAKDGIEITMEEPLGNWRFDSGLAQDYPALADSIRTNASGDYVYTVRKTYFRKIVAIQSLYVFLAALIVILFHDGVTFWQTRRKGKK